MTRLASASRAALVALTLLLGPVRGRAEPEPVRVQLLGINDFHGQLSAGKQVRGRPAGGAAVLAAYLRDEAARFSGTTFVVHAGDHVGASPPPSGLLQDEPSIQLLNLLANRHCAPHARSHPRCNLVGTPGNHEFDEGRRELLRLVHGGRSSRGAFLERPFRGARFPYVSANVVDAASGRTILPASVIKLAGGVRIGFVGAVVATTPTMVEAAGVRTLRFLEEASAINAAVRRLSRRGVRAIVVALHQGGRQPAYEGPTRPEVEGPSGEIARIVASLDDAVDVVVSGHAHAFTNALMKTASGHPILVTQAFSAGLAYAAIELTVDRADGEVVAKSARIVTTYADEGPGRTPAADVAALVADAERAVAPRTERVVGHAAEAITDAPSAAGESALGNLIADAQRAATGAEVALMNPGGIRTSLAAGPIRWGTLFTVQPFGNALIAMDLSGADLRTVLEQQWQAGTPHLLQVSGVTYAWDARRPPGARIVEVAVGGAALSPSRTYRIVVNSFLAAGGGGLTALERGTRRRVGPLDIEALASFIAGRDAPLRARIEGRIRRLDAGPVHGTPATGETAVRADRPPGEAR